ncbi:MAG TPA: class I SAM-dependent methyltransferase [Halothiobacillus sp.]|nr:class I SAM-dependent methyltransferase [Halothiobacillus sp.]
MQTLKPWPVDGLESVPNCPVCGNGRRELLYNDLTDRVFNVAPGQWTLYRCTQCESAYLDPRPNQTTIGLAYENYYTHTAEDTPEAQPKNLLVRQLHAWVNDYINVRYGLARKPAGFGGRWLVPLVPSFKAKADTKLRHLPRPPQDGGRLLDVGFGNGGFLKLASEMGWHAEGIDFDPKAVAVAKARGLNVRCASAADLSAQNEQFDIITLSHVIEHVHDPIILLKDLYRLLKPGGILWLETPNLDSLGAKRFGRNWMALDPPRHLVLFNTDSLRNSLAQAGFGQISPHWNGMVLFSIYAQSAAIARGHCGQDAVHQVTPSFTAILAELRGIVQPKKREYITFIARK